MIYTLDEIPESKIELINSGFNSVNSSFNANKSGIPSPALSMFAGEAGSGKSSLLGCIGKNIAKEHKVIYFSLEASLGNVKNWRWARELGNSFLFSEANNHEEQIRIIEENNPKFVIIDSVNLLVNKSGACIKHGEVKEVASLYTRAAVNNSCHIALIGQLGEDGNVLGSSQWTFLPDVICHINKFKIEGKLKKDLVKKFSQQSIDELVIKTKRWFSLSIPSKNRFGEAGSNCMFEHTDYGIKEINFNF